ncbi:MAG: riboflavin synthase [Polyangiaceae bacterium]|nr:riboflavin synthase [Polyangiaceae bacterium]
MTVMFTGLIESCGTVRSRERRGPGFRVRVDAELGSLALGESIAVSGVCLTVVDHDERGFAADVSLETVAKTTLGRVALGGRVNLERSLRAGDRLGGHLVSGHVDGIARVTRVEVLGEAWRVCVAPPPDLFPFLAAKGSVTLDGVSLTINAAERGEIELMLIPHTRQVTNLSELRVGSELNLEVDLLARYVVHYLRHGAAIDAPTSDDSLVRALAHAGITGSK